jgi:putative transposase
MNTIHLHDEFFELGATKATFTVTEVGLPGQRVRVLHLADDHEEVIKTDVLRLRVSAGELARKSHLAPRVPPAWQPDPALEKATAAALRHLHEVCHYSERYNVSVHQAYNKLRKARMSIPDDDACDPLPSRATLYRHLAAERDGRPVLCGDANKGNRTPRYGDQVVQLIVENAKALHQQPHSRWSLAKLTELCNLRAQEAGLLQDGRQFSLKYVKKVIFTQLTSNADIARLPPKLRAARHAVAKHSIRIHGFLQRVEQDALHLPWRVRTPAGELQDIYLVHAIDVATGLPVGWALSIGAPNSATSLACVESILFSKETRLAAMGVQMDADLYGTPTCILFDNGSEARNNRLAGLVRLGIEVQYCKSRHPHHKPFIERLNRALKEALEVLPGCTRMDGKDGQRNPSELNDLPMPLEELERWIVRWYYEDWALRPLDRLIRSDIADAADLGATPLARLQHLRDKGYAMPMSPNTDDWRFVQLEERCLTLARTTGITVEGFHFRGGNLQTLINLLGESKVQVLVDPDDFRTVQVVNGASLVTLVNADVDEATPALSFAQAKAMEKAAHDKAKADGKAIQDGFRRDLFAAATQTARTTGKRSRAEASKASTQIAKHAQAVQRTRLRPLTARATQEVATDTGVFSLDELAPLPVVDRKTGEAL